MKKQPKKSSKAALLPEAIAPKGMVANCDLKIAGRIRLIRGVQVMLDWDMAISLARFAERPALVYRRERARSVVENSPRFQKKPEKDFPPSTSAFSLHLDFTQ